MTSPAPSRRSVRHAFHVLKRLPPEALFALVEQLIDHLDRVCGDDDLEPEEDCCPAGDDDPQFGGVLAAGGQVPAGGTEDDEFDDWPPLDKDEVMLADREKWIWVEAFE